MCKNIYQETNWKELKDAIASDNKTDRQNALVKIKDAVIGSNRQKAALISNNLVPELLNIIAFKDESFYDKTDCLIILGSLAKGSNEQVQMLVERYNIIPILIREVFTESHSRKYKEICLRTMQSIYDHPHTPVDEFFTNQVSLTEFISFASAGNSLKSQISVTSILVSLCQTYDDQVRLLRAGTIYDLARMICSENECIQISALRCLASMCYSNRSVADNICVTSYHGKSLPDILDSFLSRLYQPETQLTAARCLTYIYRSGTLMSTDYRILHKTLPSLARLCSENFEETIRGSAAETLSYLIEIDSELQRTASISNNLLISLFQLLESRKSFIRQAALRCFASLGANDESIRKKLTSSANLINDVIDALGDNDTQVKLAAIKCLHSLSRSVHQMRTTFQDHVVWKPLLFLISCPPSTEFLIAATSVICNLLLEFSPSKEPLFNSGIIEKLSQLTEHNEPSLRLNGAWALMNMSYQAEQLVKTDIINTIGTKRILALLCDPDSNIVMKSLGLLRNLLSKPYHIDLIMSKHSIQVLETVNSIFDSNHSSEIKEQMLCIVGNIAAESKNGEYILSNRKIISRLGDFLFYLDQRIQAGALYAISSIVHRKDCWSEEKYYRLAELNLIKNVYEYNKKSTKTKAYCDDYIIRTIQKIIVQCNNISPDIMK